MNRQVSDRQSNHQFLLLDAHTLHDLEVFDAAGGEQSLFEFCNLARTDGGASILRQRMAQPWSNSEDIAATQASIAFMLAQRKAFDEIPSAYATSRVDRFFREILPIVVHENPFEFFLDAFSLWAHHDRHYISIFLGVQTTCSFIRSARRFVNQSALEDVSGELVPLLMEMKTLLDRPKLAAVPEQEIGRWVGKILRFDQTFRIHEKVSIARLLELIHEIDALVAMADVTSFHNFTMPELVVGPLGVQAEGLVHPFLQAPVGNHVDLGQDHRVLFLTGPNMAGKTTYLRAFATALYFAHLGMGVPASRFRFVPAQCLFSSLSLSDDLRGGVSYFRAEALRVRAVAEAIAAGYRVIAVMDEPFKGTNVKDAFDASLAILSRFATREDCLFMFSSHLIELSEPMQKTGQIDCRYFEAEEGAGRLQFDYQLRHGVSAQRLGMRVLAEEGVFELLDNEGRLPE